MHLSSVFHILGLLTMFLGVTMLAPIPFSLYYGDADWVPILIAALTTFAAGFAGFRFHEFRKDLRAKEGFAVVTFGWIIMSLFGSLPFLFSGAIPSLTDAFFETMSGFTTTGATILQDIEGLPHGVLFWRAMTHWIGGMGIIVLSLAILPFLGVGGMELFKAEVPGPTADKLTPRITETAKILWSVYVAITAIHAVLLMLGGMTLFEALCHAFATMATGGYSTLNASVGGFGSSYINYVIIFFMILAGTNFTLHYRFARGEWDVYFRNKEFRFYMGMIGLAALIICSNIFFNSEIGFWQALEDTLFQVVSIITTTGYGTADYEKWPYVSQIIIFFLMFAGGCAGSTSGGIKIIRLYVLIKFILDEILHLLHPHAVTRVRIGKTAIERGVVTNILGFFSLFILIYTLGVIAMAALGMDLLSAFGAVAATLGNIGPGLGSVGPTDNYAHVHELGKWVLSLLMLMGRLELFTVVILFSPSFWHK